ncbi:MAG: hypothetical protein Q8910_00020 [Bacteroidota bacterium]|nr:hypothetical protein [Bacteroidota bacterium]
MENRKFGGSTVNYTCSRIQNAIRTMREFSEEYPVGTSISYDPEVDDIDGNCENFTVTRTGEYEFKTEVIPIHECA